MHWYPFMTSKLFSFPSRWRHCFAFIVHIFWVLHKENVQLCAKVLEKQKRLNLIYQLSQDSERLGQRWWGVSSASTGFGEFKLHKRFHKLFGQGCWLLTGAGTEHVCQSDVIGVLNLWHSVAATGNIIGYYDFMLSLLILIQTYTILSDHFCIYEQNSLPLSCSVEREVQKYLYLPWIWKCKCYSSCWIVIL